MDEEEENSGLAKLIGDVGEDIQAYQQGGLMGLGLKLAENFLGIGGDSDSGSDDSDESSDDDSGAYSRDSGRAGDSQLRVNTDHDDDDDIDGDEEFDS